MSTKSPISEVVGHWEDSRASLRILLEQIQHGWSSVSADVARDFISQWARRLGGETEINEVGDSFVRFTCNLEAIRLHGMHEVACLLMADRGEGAAHAAMDFWRGVNSPGKAVFVLAVSAATYRSVHRGLPPGRYVLLGRSHLETILLATAPQEALKAELRRQIPLSRLVPFDTVHAAEGNMFFGRSKVLRRLHEEESISFAVAGPSRIGKTSVLKRYRSLLQRSKDPAVTSTFAIDFYKCSDKSNDGIARFIALHIDATRKSSTLTHDRIETFFAFWRNHFHRPVTLLLDEVDEVFWTRTFEYLGNAVRKGLCRLLLGGKGELLSGALQPSNPLQCRLDLLRLEPLQPPEVEQLVLGPLSDLGFEVADPLAVLGELLRLTGSMPHALQFYGSRMARRLIDRDDLKVSCDHLHKVRSTHEAASFFLAPLFEVTNRKVRHIALALMTYGTRPFSLPQIVGACDNCGVHITIDEAWEAANELVVQNVLVWKDEMFRIANESLIYYAEKQGLCLVSRYC